MHVTDGEHAAGLPDREEDACPGAVPVVVEVPAVPGASPFESSSPPVATPTTPTIGMAGNETRSFIFTTPSFTSNSRVSGDWTWSISCPKPGMSVATPHSIGRTSRISATRESPDSAPSTATGPVALLIRERSISVTRSFSLRIWPVKQSFVSKVTTSPGSTSSTGWRSGPNDQITSSREIRCCFISIPGRRIVRPAAAEHGGYDLRLAQLLRFARERVAVEHDEVGVAAGYQRAPHALIM